MAEQIDVAQHAQPIKDSPAAKPSQPKEAAAHRTFPSFQEIYPEKTERRGGRQRVCQR